MTKIEIYDKSAREIEKIADINDTTIADVVEALLKFEEEMKEDEGWE